MKNFLLSSLNNLFPRGTFIRDTALLAGGTGIAQLISIVIMPFLSRLYSPIDFGVAAFLLSIITIIGSFTSAGYLFAIPLPQEDNKVNHVAILSISIHLFLFGLLILSFFLITIPFNGSFPFLDKNIDPIYLWFVPIGFLTTGLFQVLHYRVLKKKHFELLGSIRVIQKFYGSGTMLFLGYIGMKPSGLILGQLVGQIGGFFSLLKHSNLVQNVKTTSINDLVITAKRYADFPKYHIWAVFANNLYLNIVPIALINLWGAQVTGWYAFTMKLLQMPSTLIGQAISQVYLQRGSETTESAIGLLTLKIFKALLAISTFPLISLMIIAPELFSLVFGKGWYMSGVYCRIFIPLVWINFVTSPISTIFVIQEKQRHFLLLQILMLGGTVCLLYFGTLFQNTLFSLILYGYGAFGVRHIYLIVEMKTANCSLKTVYLTLFSQLGKSLFIASPCLVLEMYGISIWIRICLILVLLIPWFFFNRDDLVIRSKKLLIKH